MTYNSECYIPVLEMVSIDGIKAETQQTLDNLLLLELKQQ